MHAMIESLNIPMGRRIIGATMVVGMYAVALVAFIRPHAYDHLAAVNSPLLPSSPDAIALVALCCGSILSPFILYPCVFNRFPRWMYAYFGDLRLKAMAKQFFGTRGPDEKIQ